MKSQAISLAVAAQQLGVPWRKAWDMLLTGDLRGTQDARGRWHVNAEDVARLASERAAAGLRPTAAHDREHGG